MKAVDRAKLTVHLQRARSLFGAMQLLVDEPQTYGPAICLLAVHSAISLSDAILIAYTGKRSIDQNHRFAAKPLRALCHTMKADDDGIKHLAWLVGRKTDFSYGDRPVSDDEVRHAAQTTERYQAWVHKTFPDLVGFEPAAG
jgi:hypothetical protein